MPLHIGRGPRLEFVVRELKGKRKRAFHAWSKELKKVVETTKEEAAGYMVFFPNGTSYRLTREQLLAQGYDREPAIINFELVNDTKSPAGVFKYAMNEKTKQAAYRKLEEQVIRACKRAGGHADTGDVNDAEAA
jgi:hypothetical protein